MINSNSEFRNFLRSTWSGSSFYRNLYMQHGIHFDDLDALRLQDLPIITKQMVIESFDEVVTDPAVRDAELQKWLEQDKDPRNRFLNKYLGVFSSKTSGVEFKMIFDETAWNKMSAAAAVYLHPEKIYSGIKYRNAFFIGSVGHFASATTALNASEATFNSLVLSMRDPIEETISRLNAYKPDRVTGYASSVGWLAEIALRGHLEIFPRDVVVSGDRMTPAIEAKIRQAWDSRIYDLYAADKSPFIALKEPGRSSWKVFDEFLAIEVLDSNDNQVQKGQIGRAVLTNWVTSVLPLIRYDMTDYVICGERRPGYSTLDGFVGRSFENLPTRLSDGSIGEIPSYELATLDIPDVDVIQFISHSPDRVEVQYCASQDLDALLSSKLDTILKNWGSPLTQINFRRVDHIWNNRVGSKFSLVRHPDDPQLVLQTNVFDTDKKIEPELKLRPGEGFIPQGRELLERTIVSVFEEQAVRKPAAIAVNDASTSLTYEELNQRANQVAGLLRERTMDPAHPVALLFSHGASMIVAMLGVLKSGGWYVPLDPSHPEIRNQIILRETHAGILLTDKESISSAGLLGFSEDKIIKVDELEESALSPNLGVPGSPESPACILYTSGSTGTPKGVVLDHRAILHRVYLYTNDYAIGPGDNLALLQSYLFNASIRDIFGALVNGACLKIYSIKRSGLQNLPAWLEREDVSVVYMVPSLFRAFLDILQVERFEKLRLVRLGGEAVLARDVIGFQRHFGPGCILANGLASTETGTTCQLFLNSRTRITEQVVPVGEPVEDKKINFLDEYGAPIQDGQVGEMVVDSSFVGPGYFPLPKSAINSGPDTERSIHTGDLGYRKSDNEIVLVGRRDSQIKLRGQRINLLEIEHCPDRCRQCRRGCGNLPG